MPGLFFECYLCCLWIPEVPKLREYIRKRLLDKKRRLVTKYVTEAFGLLLLTDTFNPEESLLVRKPLGCLVLCLNRCKLGRPLECFICHLGQVSQLAQLRTWHTREEEASAVELPSSNWPVGMSGGHFLGVGRSSPLLALPLRGRRTWAVKERELSKPDGASQCAVSLQGLCFSSCLGFPTLSWAVTLNINEPFPPLVGHGVDHNHSRRWQTGTVGHLRCHTRELT